MRVAVVCPYAWDRPGGVQSHVRGLSGALRGRGHDVVVLAPHASSRCESTDEVAIVGRAVGIPANGSVAPLAFGPLAAAGVRRALAAFEPDVCHLHEPLIPSLSLLALWAGGPAPRIGTFHAAAESSIGYRASRVILERAARRLAVRTAVSDAARALAARYFPGEYVLTPNGVDVARFTPRVDAPRGRTVLFLSRIERRKGLEVLIQAMARLRDTGARLVVAGDGPEAKAARLLASRLGVDADWRGVVSDAEKVELFRSAGVYCAPGLGGESFGIVLVEAMAAGAAVVCSDLPGFKAVAGGAAVLVPPGDAGALAGALRHVLEDDAEAARMRKMSLRMSGSFDWARLASGVEAVYEKALAGQPA